MKVILTDTFKKQLKKLDAAISKRILELLLRTDGGTGCMHESFNVDDPSVYTREWFSWADAFFCTLVLDYCGLYSAD